MLMRGGGRLHLLKWSYDRRYSSFKEYQKNTRVGVVLQQGKSFFDVG